MLSSLPLYKREPVSMGIYITRFVALIIFLFSYSSFAFAQDDDLPDEFIISDFVGKAQSYSLSCESRAAVDWAAFWGVEISETEFLFNLPTSDNPDVGFVGNPNDLWGFTPPRSYGVHAEPVAALLRDYGLQAEAQRGLGWDDLRAEIAAGRPAIVWIIGQMWTGQVREYTASDGQVVLVAPYEHTMVLYGYTNETVNVLDVYSGRKQTYNLEVFLKSWSVLGNMAVFGQGVEQHHSPDVVQEDDLYTVVRGDYLVLLADRFQTDWKTLVTLNDLTYPYTLYPGQVLRLPTQSLDDLSQLDNTDQDSEQVVTPTNMDESGEITYTVKPGDYLSRVAYQLGLNWRQLASYNNISFPYTLYPGQVLRWSSGDESQDDQEEGKENSGNELDWGLWHYHHFRTIPSSGRIIITWPF
jgi:LysM repeat protein/uncharacterized protein YvpB